MEWRQPEEGNKVHHGNHAIIHKRAMISKRSTPELRLVPFISNPSIATNIAMTDSKELRSTGLKATLPRLKVLELFQNSTERHMTAEDVFKILLNENADIGLATVYRVLTQFEQAGLLMRHHFESGKAVFELNEGSHHDHLVCLQCGKVEEFYDSEIEKRQIKIAKDRGFNIHDHSLYLYADCTKPKCPNKHSTQN